MMILNHRTLRDTGVRTTKIVLRDALLLLLIPTISVFMGCASPTVKIDPVTPTRTAQATTAAAAKLTATSLTFIADADAQVRESDPHLNYGDALELMVDGGDDPHVESFIRFNVTGITGPVHSARLRLYATENVSRHGPVVYATTASWNESTINWTLRPARISDSLDEKDRIDMDTWVEYDVTLFVSEDKIYSFALTTDRDDASIFSSREGSKPPELVITLVDGSITAPGIPVTGATPVPKSTYIPSDSFLFTAEMDARVKESSPERNYANSSILQTDSDSDPAVESFIRFTVTGILGKVLNAQLRVYVTSNGSKNGPAVYATEPSWTELGLTWNTRPARTSSAVDNKDRIRANRWVEYDVTSLIHGDGKYSFVLAADSNDAVNFSSREGVRPPQLVMEVLRGSTAISTLSAGNVTPDSISTQYP